MNSLMVVVVVEVDVNSLMVLMVVEVDVNSLTACEWC